jgi:hypothetical protein
VGGKSILTAGNASRSWTSSTALGRDAASHTADPPDGRQPVQSAGIGGVEPVVARCRLDGELYAQRCLSRIRPGAMTKVANTPVRRSPSSTPRRAIRSAAGDGIPIEDLGIPGIPYEMTRADLMNGNKDLLGFCTDMLR